MIDRTIFIIKRGRRYYKAFCDKCGADRGYKTPDHADRPCVQCNCVKANKISVVSRKNKPHVKRTCSIEGCNLIHKSQGYCGKHYNYLIRPPTPKNIDGTINLKCDHCNKKIVSKRKRKYCSDTCNTNAYRERHKNIINARSRKYNKNNRDKRTAHNREWCKNNRDKVIEYRERIENRIKANLRSRLSRAVKRQLKGGSAVKDLGCSIGELRSHLEDKFTEGMSWDNYGKWHIDHIKPLDIFDLTNSEDLKVACHYSNLQPLWATDNLSKGAKYD